MADRLPPEKVIQAAADALLTEFNTYLGVFSVLPPGAYAAVAAPAVLRAYADALPLTPHERAAWLTARHGHIKQPPLSVMFADVRADLRALADKIEAERRDTPNG